MSAQRGLTASSGGVVFGSRDEWVAAFRASAPAGDTRARKSGAGVTPARGGITGEARVSLRAAGSLRARQRGRPGRDQVARSGAAVMLMACSCRNRERSIRPEVVPTGVDRHVRIAVEHRCECRPVTAEQTDPSRPDLGLQAGMPAGIRLLPTGWMSRRGQDQAE
jgi:hypothetical protein